MGIRILKISHKLFKERLGIPNSVNIFDTRIPFEFDTIEIKFESDLINDDYFEGMQYHCVKLDNLMEKI